jgi:hypothetical protein
MTGTMTGTRHQRIIYLGLQRFSFSGNVIPIGELVIATVTADTDNQHKVLRRTIRIAVATLTSLRQYSSTATANLTPGHQSKLFSDIVSLDVSY